MMFTAIMKILSMDMIRKRQKGKTVTSLALGHQTLRTWHCAPQFPSSQDIAFNGVTLKQEFAKEKEINLREWTIQRNWQHRIHKTQDK